MEKLTVIEEEKKLRTHKWERNHQIIRDCFIKYVQKHNRPPTITYLHENTDISWKTVSLHVKEGFDFGKAIRKFRVLSEQVLMSVYQRAIQGNPASQRLFFELVEPDIFTEKMIDVKPLSIQINTIQPSAPTNHIKLAEKAEVK